MIQPLLRAYRRLLRDRRGMSALELVLVAAVLAPAIIAVVDIGNAAQQQIELQQALRAGGQYAMTFPADPSNTSNVNSANIKTVVTAALPSNWTSGSTKDITVGASTASCTCYPSGTSVTCFSGACAAGQTPEGFITLTASTVYSGTFLNTTINASYVVRFQ